MLIKLLTYPIFAIGAYMIAGPSILVVAAVFFVLGAGYRLLKGSRAGA